MSINFKRSLKLISFLFIISFLVIYLFSIGTSPFYGNYYTSDASIFITIGKAMKEGKIVYKEIFDHKGQFFFIQMIGQFIYEGKIGIFVIEVFSLFITNLFLYKTICLFTSNKNAFISVLTSMIFMSYFIETGNYSEEYSIPFLAICLYLAIKWLKGNNQFSNKNNLYAFIYGLCFSIIAFIRLNNAALICGLMLAITIIFIKNRKFLDLIKSALFFVLGIILVCLPIFIYFYKVDAIYDMLYGTFIHNFLYINSGIQSNMSTIAKIIVFIIITLLAFFNCTTFSKDKNFKLLIFCTYISTLITLHIGPGFNNYYILSVPLIALLMPPVISVFSSHSMNIIFKIFVITYVCIMYIIGCFIPQLYYKFDFNSTRMQNINTFIEDNISINDKNNILALGLFTAPIYLYGNFLPCYKYAFMQDYLFVSNPELMEETYNYIKEGNIKYILYENLNNKENKNKLQNLIYENYFIKDSMYIIEKISYVKNLEKLFYTN